MGRNNHLGQTPVVPPVWRRRPGSGGRRAGRRSPVGRSGPLRSDTERLAPNLRRSGRLAFSRTHHESPGREPGNRTRGLLRQALRHPRSSIDRARPRPCHRRSSRVGGQIPGPFPRKSRGVTPPAGTALALLSHEAGGRLRLAEAWRNGRPERMGSARVRSLQQARLPRCLTRGRPSCAGSEE